MGFLNSIFSFIILSIVFNQFVLHHLPLVAAKDVLFPGDELNSHNLSSILISANEMFTLGFFSVPHEYLEDNFTYLGIWYSNDPLSLKKKVWVTNRDIPILGNGVLMIDDSGTLKLTDGNGNIFFNVSNQFSSGNKNTRAVLQDSGNFIVYDSIGNRSLWQSFDYPTDTIVLGMKLGYNLTTKQNWTLNSWLSDVIPATGAFTMRLDEYRNSPQLLIYRHGEIYWASGPWEKDNGTFQFLDLSVSSNLTFAYKLSFISDPSGSGMYSFLETIKSVQFVLQLNPKGQLFDATDGISLTPEFCYGYERDNGCVVSALPNCRSQNHSFEWISGDWTESGSLDGSLHNYENASISLNDCMEICWKDCNCLGFSTFFGDGTGCLTWSGDETFQVDESGQADQKYVLVSRKPHKTKDVLFPGDELNSHNLSSVLISANEMFTLGFFTVPHEYLEDNFTYLGIWYSYDPLSLKKKVWVANCDTPILGNGVLMIDDSGTLKLTDENGIIFFNVSNQLIGFGNKNTRAVLQDSGNFLVYDSIENRDLWQSFDYPTDTIVLGMKLGYNLTTKHNWTLNSWLSDVTPATGSFTMRLEEYRNSPQLLIYRHGEIYWASGPWEKDNGTFQFLDLSVNSALYELSLISDPSGMYCFLDGFVQFGLQLNPKGQLVNVTDGISLTPEFCYGYQRDNGCVVSALPNCRSQNDNFEWKSGDWNGFKYNEMTESGSLDGSLHNYVNASLSLNDCMEICWKDCNCLGFSTLFDGTGCMTWSGDNKTFQVDESGVATRKYVLVSKIPPKKKTWIWKLVSLVIVLTSALTSCLCFVRIRKRRLKAEEKRRKDDYIHQLTGGSDSFNYGDEIERGIQDAPDVKIFSLGAILTATNSFSNENKLGQGGYGPVYKGKLFDGREIAVKKLSKTSRQGFQEFKSELILISKLQHTNLVRLYGCCIHQEEKMLIYEFMPNKSLDFFLFAEDKKEKISWQIRFDIIEGVAQGLLYLHKYSRMKVIHRDLKVSNILLDGNMNPKIADFGMARIFKQDVAEVVTNRVVGTYGYMAPEYAMHGTFSIKSDVFSFGVLILEIVSGKKNSSFHNYDMPLNLVGYAWELWKREAALELKDEGLGESYDVNQLLRVIHVGLLCVQENANDRPTMSEVISMLKNEIADLPVPNQPAFFIHLDEVQQSRSAEHLLGNNIQASLNGLTITNMEAR